jgi:hypothetical protein
MCRHDDSLAADAPASAAEKKKRKLDTQYAANDDGWQVISLHCIREVQPVRGPE